MDGTVWRDRGRHTYRIRISNANTSLHAAAATASTTATASTGHTYYHHLRLAVTAVLVMMLADTHAADARRGRKGGISTPRVTCCRYRGTVSAMTQAQDGGRIAKSTSTTAVSSTPATNIPGSCGISQTISTPTIATTTTSTAASSQTTNSQTNSDTPSQESIHPTTSTTAHPRAFISNLVSSPAAAAAIQRLRGGRRR